MLLCFWVVDVPVGEEEAAGLGCNKEPRTSSRYPMWLVGSQELEPALLPARLCLSRRLGGKQRKDSDPGCEHPKV